MDGGEAAAPSSPLSGNAPTLMAPCDAADVALISSFGQHVLTGFDVQASEIPAQAA